jgi:hypothetical protein
MARAPMCIPVDSMLWALIARVRDDGYLVTDTDLRALLGSGCSREHLREVLERASPGNTSAFVRALEVLSTLE